MAGQAQVIPAVDPFAPSQAGMDLGMGADLQSQVMQQVLERRKRAMLAANQTPAAFGGSSYGGRTLMAQAIRAAWPFRL